MGNWKHLKISFRFQIVCCVEKESDDGGSLSVRGVGAQVHVTQLLREVSHHLLLQLRFVGTWCWPRMRKDYAPIWNIFWLPLDQLPLMLSVRLLYSTNMISSVSVGNPRGPIIPSVKSGVILLFWFCMFCQLLQQVSSIGCDNFESGLLKSWHTWPASGLYRYNWSQASWNIK